MELEVALQLDHGEEEVAAVGAEVDFGSLLFNSVIARRLSLHPGEERKVDVIVLQLPDLNGKRTTHTYRRLEDEEIETKAKGTVQASVYELVGPEATHKLWFDSSGFALRGHFELPAGTFEHELVRLQEKKQVW